MYVWSWELLYEIWYFSIDSQGVSLTMQNLQAEQTMVEWVENWSNERTAWRHPRAFWTAQPERILSFRLRLKLWLSYLVRLKRNKRIFSWVRGQVVMSAHDSNLMWRENQVSCGCGWDSRQQVAKGEPVTNAAARMAASLRIQRSW